MKEYGIYLRLEALRVLQSASPARRRKLAAFIDELAHDPETPGDYEEKDDADRSVRVRIVGAFAVVYWADHPVGEVKVVEIRPADKV